MRSWVLAASLLAAAAATGAQAADLYDAPPPDRYGSAYDDPRYADIYKYPPPRPYAAPPRAYERYAEPPIPRERVYREDERYYEPKYLPGPRRYSYAEPPRGYADRCVPREVVKDRLLRAGWHDFHDGDVQGDIATVRARRPSGRLFALAIDRCSGEIVSAEPLEPRRFGPIRLRAAAPPLGPTLLRGKRPRPSAGGLGSVPGAFVRFQPPRCVPAADETCLGRGPPAIERTDAAGRTWPWTLWRWRRTRFRAGRRRGCSNAPTACSCALRAGSRPGGPRRGTVCVFHGRGEFIEKYFEVVADLRRRGFTVATMDWRGQGGSARMLKNPSKGYVRSFADYDQDLAHFMREIVLPDCQPPYVALAHSMGGNILLRNASLSGSWFSRMVLSAPMIAISRQKLGAPQAVSRLYAEALAGLGLGALYARGGRDTPLEFDPFEGNPLTSDRERYQRNRLVLEAAPALGLGSPTVAWLRASLRSIARLTAPDYPLKVEVPLLLFAAGMDSIVSSNAIEEFALRLKVGTHVMFPQARHEILQETDEIRQRFWAAFDAYLGVEATVA